MNETKTYADGLREAAAEMNKMLEAVTTESDFEQLDFGELADRLNAKAGGIEQNQDGRETK